MEVKDIVRAYPFEKKRLAMLVSEAKGSERTMAQFAEDTGISAPTLSRIVNGKIVNPLSDLQLQKIFANKCKDATFTFESLLAANGMVDSETAEKGKDYIERTLSNRERGLTLERHAKNAIVNAVMDRGGVVQNIPLNLDARRNQSPYGIQLQYDFCLYLPREKQQLWYFDVVDGSRRLPPSMGNTFSTAARLFLLDAWSPEFFANQKTSFVFGMRMMYEQFILQYKGAPIKSAMSAILINEETETVIEETWLSSSPEVQGILSREVTARNY